MVRHSGLAQSEGDGLPSIEQLLVAGGDARIALDPFSGLNKYGCQPFPDISMLSFGSSTALVVSTVGFAAAERLRQRLLLDLRTVPQEVIYEREMLRIRAELLELCGLTDISGLEVVFATSGTDIHSIVGQYAMSGEARPALAVMVEADETGSSVAAALAGRYSNSGGLGRDGDIDGASIAGGNALEVVPVAIRHADGAPRQLQEVDAAVEVLVTEAIAMGRRVLLILADQSKTGLIAPSPACIAKLYRRHPDRIDVLVDACQFRIAPPTLQAYLEQGFMVALTGSKFVTGPSFSAVLLLSSVAAQRLRQRTFPHALSRSSSKANWPPGWNVAKELGSPANFGLLLRWVVALEELRRFGSLSQEAVIDFLQDFAHAIRHRLMSDPLFELLPAPELDRRPLIRANSWDHLQTIFPFLLYHTETYAGRRPLCREETMQVYRWLPVDLAENHAFINYGDANEALLSKRCQLGQPVACGSRSGVAVSALRICASARLIVEAISPDGKGAADVIENALAALDKTALLIRSGRRPDGSINQPANSRGDAIGREKAGSR